MQIKKTFLLAVFSTDAFKFVYIAYNFCKVIFLKNFFCIMDCILIFFVDLFNEYEMNKFLMRQRNLLIHHDE